MRLSCPPISASSLVPAYSLTVLTTDPTAKIPDTATLGSALPPGECEWRVGAMPGAANADDLAAPAGWERFTTMNAAVADGTYVETALRKLVAK
jgi:hypothetical protein